MMKGQFLINGILGLALAVIVYIFVWYPVIQVGFIDPFLVANPDLDTATALMIQLLSFIVIFAIALSVISFINPPQLRQPGG